MIISSRRELVSALGGPKAVGEYCGMTSEYIRKWTKKNGYIPPGWHLRFWAEARKLGYDVDLVKVFELTEEQAEALAGRT